MTTSHHLMLSPDLILAELSTLGEIMDKLDTQHITGGERAKRMHASAICARQYIEAGANYAAVRYQCLKSPSLLAILEAVLFDRAAEHGTLALTINWKGYGR